MASLAGKVFVVTGAASGMGLATTKVLLERGASLGVCDINKSLLEQYIGTLSEEQKGKILVEPVSVTDESAICGFLDQTKQRFGKLDGIANFAGTGGHKLGQQLITDIDQLEYDFIMDLNVRALYFILRHALQPDFLKEPGSFVHVTSMYAERGFQNGAIFTASKHAANGMVQSAALEVAQRRIRVNTVMPGVIDTPMTRRGRTDLPPPAVPMGRYGLAEEIAYMTAFLLGDEASYITGAHMLVDGGANAAGRHE